MANPRYVVAAAFVWVMVAVAAGQQELKRLVPTGRPGS